MSVIPPQFRYVDPYSSYESKNVNKLTSILYPYGYGIISGLDVSILDQTKLLVSKGTALKDYVLLDFPYNIEIDKSQTSVSSETDIDCYLVINYSYKETYPPPVAKIDVIKIEDYVPNSKWIRLAKIVIDINGYFIIVDTTPRIHRDIGLFNTGLNCLSRERTDWPEVDGLYDLGTEDKKWNRIFSNTFVGNLDGVANISLNIVIDDSDPNNLIYTSSKNVLLKNTNNIPINDGIYDLGAETYRWKNVYCKELHSETIRATHIIGRVTDADRIGGIDSQFIMLKTNTNIPTIDDSFDLGSSEKRWKNIYATEFHGTNYYGEYFRGIATEAQAADLAEKYTFEREPKPGLVVCISEDENYDCEICNEIACNRVIGVVSKEPALMMNSTIDGYYVALKGRVRCKVKGPVKKGDPLISYLAGCAISLYNEFLVPRSLLCDKETIVFARALQSINSNDVKYIEVVL